MSLLQRNTLPLLHRGTSYVFRITHYDTQGVIFIRSLTNDAQANIRAGRNRYVEQELVTGVIPALTSRDHLTRIDLPIAGDPLNPYVAVDCTKGKISVELLTPHEFVSQLRG